ECDVSALVELSVLTAVENLADQVAPRPADDVLLFDRVTVHWRALVFPDHHDFLAIGGLAIAFDAGVSIAQREGDEPDPVEGAGAEVGDVPAELADADFVTFGASAAPILRAPEGERRQVESILAK